MQNTCYGLNWSTGNYDLFYVDTARKTNTTSEWASALKTEQEWSSGKGTCLPSPSGEGGTGTSYNGLYGEAPIKMGTFFML